MTFLATDGWYAPVNGIVANLKLDNTFSANDKECKTKGIFGVYGTKTGK